MLLFIKLNRTNRKQQFSLSESVQLEPQCACVLCIYMRTGQKAEMCRQLSVTAVSGKCGEAVFLLILYIYLRLLPDCVL